MKINSELKSTLTGQDELHEQHLKAVNTLADMYVHLKKQKADTEASRIDVADASESYKRQKIQRDEGIQVRKDASETAALNHTRMVNTFTQATEQIDKHNRTMLTGVNHQLSIKACPIASVLLKRKNSTGPTRH